MRQRGHVDQYRTVHVHPYEAVRNTGPVSSLCIKTSQSLPTGVGVHRHREGEQCDGQRGKRDGWLTHGIPGRRDSCCDESWNTKGHCAPDEPRMESVVNAPVPIRSQADRSRPTPLITEDSVTLTDVAPTFRFGITPKRYSRLQPPAAPGQCCQQSAIRGDSSWSCTSSG
jgi:hypothetical protein